ncbi:hypothetical protein MK367_03725 [Streptococcus sanguinis]|uniref:Uncharacterized protein n=2 Tax=Streptococcus sanguinis TaxID=1305 RepID=F3U9E5_STRSA|nr:hypothetical protein [Streptococcus sanguinis]EGJ40250.1 hypothetical protein HMPREF9393_0248 [Streptococcus sanguinis SK1056]MBZ2061211.1 hypothetical protein [Streptococcus sanguinis]MBZ2063446.1 hypothetical protein [Streptococcus sanguinis]MCY7025654.1 hypothetical protein [Streptococcus sanguinis]
MFRKKYILITIMTLGFVLIGVFIFCFTVFNKRTPEIEYEVFKRPEIDYIETFGEEDKFVLIQSSDGDIFPNGGLGQRYFVTDARRFDRASSSERPSEGWYWNVYIYDVEQKKPNAQKVDLYALVKKYDSSYYLGALGSVIYQNGQDYQILELRKWKGDSPTFVLLNLETHKIEDENPILQNLKSRYQYRLGDLVAGTNFYNLLIDKGALLDRDFLASISDNTLSEDINLSQEYSKIVRKIRDTSIDSYIGFRQGLVSAEDEYQTLRHWFAPVGQDKLEVIGTNSYTGETKVLNTYDEFQEWGAWNKNEQKNN